MLKSILYMPLERKAQIATIIAAFVGVISLILTIIPPSMEPLQTLSINETPKKIKDLENTFLTAQKNSDTHSRDNIYQELVNQSLNTGRVSFAISVAKEIYDAETKDSMLIEIVNYAIESSDVESAKKAMHFIFNPKAKDEANQKINKAMWL